MKRFAALLLISLSLAAISFGTASADVNNFYISEFTSDQTLTRNDPQGELHIIEHISVVFTDNNHGIYRQIPTSYKGHPLKLRVNNVSSETYAPAQFTIVGNGSYVSLKIGNPDKTVTGPQEYTIDYTVNNVIGFYPDHDELYWDVNGNGWNQGFLHVSATLHQPSGAQEFVQPICFTGGYGSTDKNCTIKASNSTITFSATKTLDPQQTLTYITSYKKGYFTPTTGFDTFKDYAPSVLEVAAPIVLLGGGSILYWLKRGRDAKGTGVIIPQYGPPKDLTPLESGVVDIFKISGKDITATIIDLGIRGYIKIIETKKIRPLFPDSLHYTLERTSKDQSSLTKNEAGIITALFENVDSENSVDVSELTHKLSSYMADLSKSVETDLTTRGYFRGNPLKVGATLIIIAFVSLFSLQFLHVFLGADQKMSGPIIIGTVVGFLIALTVARYMPARTAKGVEAEKYLKGLKLFLNVTEKERLKKMQSPDASYAANAHEPVKTVDLFEKLLPYAIVLGVEKEWAGQFANIYTSPPNWYVGNYAAFNAVNFTTQLNSGIGGALNNAFSASSGSGVGGGGGAGGGGGGGGGGGW
jgi:hypothetical protein